MKPHDRAHAGGGHGIGGLEVRENITLHSSVEGRAFASTKLAGCLGSYESASYSGSHRRRWAFGQTYTKSFGCPPTFVEKTT